MVFVCHGSVVQCDSILALSYWRDGHQCSGELVSLSANIT